MRRVVLPQRNVARVVYAQRRGQGHVHDDNPQEHLGGQLQPFQELSQHFFYYNLPRERMKHSCFSCL
jgi:hypothetical protein